jgi:hypothetical protein
VRRPNWKEEGAACQSAGTPRIGTRIIQQSFVNQHHRVARLSVDPSGVVCEIDVPLAAIRAPRASETTMEENIFPE